MCRLMYLPTGVRPKRPILLDWMQKLSASNGGHGCGYATLRGGVVKGVELTEAACARELSRRQGAALWHTRWASVGAQVDELCHPFDSGRNSWVAHNGTWRQGAFTAKCLRGKWSDTAVAALFIRLHGWSEFVNECDSGVWLRLTPKGLQVLYRSGQLHVETETGALATEPCDGWGSWAPAEFGAYRAGEPVRYKRQKVEVDVEWTEAVAMQNARALNRNTIGNLRAGNKTQLFKDLLRQ